MALVRFFSSISVLPIEVKANSSQFSGFLNPILPKRGQKTPRGWKETQARGENPESFKEFTRLKRGAESRERAFSRRCVRRIAVVQGEVEQGGSYGDGSECLIWSFRWRRTGLPVSLITIQALLEAAPSAETVRQSRRLVLVFDPLAEGDRLGRNSSLAACEVDIVEVLEPSTMTRFPRRFVCALHQEHSQVWTQLISTKFSNCEQVQCVQFQLC